MAGLEKTSRLFNLLLWLLKSGHHGISLDYILDEYHISRKTLSRDLKELNKINDFLTVHIDKNAQRLSASFNPSFSKKNTHESENLKNRFDIFHQVDRTLTQDEAIVVHPKDQIHLKISQHELSYLIHGCISAQAVTLHYHGKERILLPLFFCYYGERWYLIGASSPQGFIFKFRADKIAAVKIQKYHKKPTFGAHFSSVTHIQHAKSKLLEIIHDSQNIFVDLNQEKKLKISFRFYFDLEFIKKEVNQFRLLPSSQKDAQNVQCIEIEFRGYQEAKMFMNKWLGHFSILAPEWIIDQYMGEVEEALDILKV